MAQEKPAAPPVIPPVPKTFKLLGHNYVTPDLVAKVTGRAKYAEDFRADGMVFIKLMPSPRPHARVVSIDATAALAMPGVHGILTADDLPAPPAPPTPPAAAPPAKKAEGDAPPAKKADSTDNPPPAKKASGAAAGAVAGVQGAPRRTGDSDVRRRHRRRPHRLRRRCPRNSR